MWNVAMGIMIAVVLLVIFTSPKTVKFGSWFSKYDDTDNLAKRQRSGLILYIDYGTGCHYLKSGAFDALVPRLDKNGNQVCEYQHKEIKDNDR
jgi:hypothetical protein